MTDLDIDQRTVEMLEQIRTLRVGRETAFDVALETACRLLDVDGSPTDTDGLLTYDDVLKSLGETPLRRLFNWAVHPASYWRSFPTLGAPHLIKQYLVKDGHVWSAYRRGGAFVLGHKHFEVTPTEPEVIK